MPSQLQRGLQSRPQRWNVSSSRSAHAEHAITAEHSSQVLGEFVADLETSLGDDFLRQAPVPEPEPLRAAASAQSSLPTPDARRRSALPWPAPRQRLLQLALWRVAPRSGSRRPASYTYGGGTQAAHFSSIARRLHPLLPSCAPFGEEAGVDLAEMFGELKHDLESDVATGGRRSRDPLQSRHCLPRDGTSG